MVENGRGSHGEQNPTGGVTQNRRKSWWSKAKQSRVFKLWSPAFWLFFGDVDVMGMMAGLQASRLVPSLTGTVASFGSMVGSVWQLPSHSLTHVCLPSPISSFFYLFRKSLTASLSFIFFTCVTLSKGICKEKHEFMCSASSSSAQEGWNVEDVH